MPFSKDGRSLALVLVATLSCLASACRAPVYYWNTHHDECAYAAFEQGTVEGVTHTAIPNKVLTETGRNVPPPWTHESGYYWGIRFKEGPTQSPNLSLDPAETVTFSFRVIKGDGVEKEATHGEDYRFIEVNWDTYEGTGVVLQPDPSSDMSYPVFTQTIPAPGGETGISGFKIIFEVCNDDVFEGPETFWVKVDSVQCATSRMLEGSRTVMRAVIVDDDNELNIPSSKPAPDHFSWEPAPFELWADLKDPPTRLISETGADASIPTISGVSGECFPWRLVFPKATPVDATLTLSVVSLPGDQPADNSDFHLFYGAGASRTEAIPVSTNPGVFEIPVSLGSTNLVIQLQAVNGNHWEEAGSLEAVCLEALSLEDDSGNALFSVGDPSRIRFIIVEE